MDLLRLPPPQWWAPGLSEAVEQAMGAEAARVEDIRRSQEHRIRTTRRLVRVIGRVALFRALEAVKRRRARRALDKLINTVYRQRYEAGDRLQLLWCRDLCAHIQHPLPSWWQKANVLEYAGWQRELAAPRGYRSKPPTFEQYLKGERRGRRSEPDRLKNLIIIEGVGLAEDWGIEGAKVFEFATACIVEYRMLPGGARLIESEARNVERRYYSILKHCGVRRDYRGDGWVQAAVPFLRRTDKVPHDVAIRLELEVLMSRRLDDLSLSAHSPACDRPLS